MNKVHTFSRRALAVLTACIIPVTGLLSSASLSAVAADDNYITSDTTKSSVISKGKTGSTTIPGRSIADNSSGYVDYTYTGNIYTANSSMYDYRSDEEVRSDKITNSHASGYTDPYMALNKAISSRIISAPSENLTILFKNDQDGNHDIKVTLYNGSAEQNNGSLEATMTYDSVREKYVYTVKYDDIGFIPSTFIINGLDKENKRWYANAVSRELEKGKSYLFDSDNITVGTADGIEENICDYPTPLYFGCFYLGDYGSNYTVSNKPDYSNFYWQANISQRADVTDNNKINFDSSVQGIVDKKLKDDTISQNDVILPYFSDEWADNHPNLVNYWHDIAFPFYEITVDANKVYGDDVGIAKYYQFNSKEENLYLETDNTNKTARYKETSTQIYSQDTLVDNKTVATVCYLPFNSENNSKENNLGFGTTFEINFQIREDGKVDTYDKNGERTGSSVNATFEFMGDDDVWVFIDGNLILDLGGDHKDTTGIIDFAEKKAYANDAIILGDGGNKDNVEGHLSSQKIVELEDVMSSDTFKEDGSYNEETVHTLKMFYMERGMYESDLLVRFNFSAVPNRNTLKIQEVTKFTGVNEGLLSLTQQAADGDVFNYTVSNAGTEKTDVSNSGILSPTYDYYQRDNDGLKTLLTGQVVGEDTTHVYLDTSKLMGDGKQWTSDGAQIAVYLYGGTGTAKTIFGEYVSDNLYRFDITGGYTKLDFVRVSSSFSGNFTSTGYVPDSECWNKVQNITFQSGATYQITDWDSGSLKTETLRTAFEYEYNNFDPTKGNAVANTNYIWTDEFASQLTKSQKDDDIDGMTGTTDKNGAFHLMYGTEEKESSAEFQGQFKRSSTMTVVQNDDLKTVTRTNPETTPETFSTSRARTVGEYYNTTVKVVDKFDNEITMTGNDYTYNNADTVDSKEPVQLTETFTNIPKVGALTVTKKLDPTDKVTDTFTFQLEMINVFGVKDNNVSDYSAIIANYPISTDGQFTLQGGQAMVIEGIPYGTKYKVTEVSTSENYEQVSNTNESYEQVYVGTLDNDSGEFVPDSQNEETIVNTRLTNSLTLQKELAGDYTETDVDKDTTFTFNVTLKAPNGVDLSLYTIEPETILGAYNKDAGTYSFTVKVSANESVTISGIPYGTTYTVSEPASELPDDNWTKSDDVTGTIGKAASIAAITNTYTPTYGSLKVSKNVLDSNGSEDISESDKDKEFKFTVTLTDKSEAAVTGTYATIVTLANGDETEGSLNFVDGTATFQLKDDESLTIVQILTGYHFSVTEADETDFEQIAPEGSADGVISDKETEVKFTNQKIQEITYYVLPDAGMEDMRMPIILMLCGMLSCGLVYWYVNREKVKKS